MNYSLCSLNYRVGISKFVFSQPQRRRFSVASLHPRLPHLLSHRLRRLNVHVIAANPCTVCELKEMESSSVSEKSLRTVKLKAIEATPETFAEFGQVVGVFSDGEKFGPNDAQLDLSRGIPRLYIMHLEKQPLKFSTITHHASVTQCLASVGGEIWYLGVAKPSVVDDNGGHADGEQKVVRSSCGHLYVPPPVDDVRVFKISGPKFIKLHTGTWHAGPLFEENARDFYNLELSNTNIVDHTTHSFNKEDGVSFVVED